jgi:hypothetical protein
MNVYGGGDVAVMKPGFGRDLAVGKVSSLP